MSVTNRAFHSNLIVMAGCTGTVSAGSSVEIGTSCGAAPRVAYSQWPTWISGSTDTMAHAF